MNFQSSKLRYRNTIIKSTKIEYQFIKIYYKLKVRTQLSKVTNIYTCGAKQDS